MPVQFPRSPVVLLVIGCAVLVAAATVGAQPKESPAVTEVRGTLAAARKAIDAHKTAGGSPASADHPAIKWDAELWAFRQKYPDTDAAALASAEAVRLLVRAQLWDRVHARVASLDADDRAWERLAVPIYDEGIARKDLQYTIDTLSKTAAATTTASIKSAALLVIGRAHRRRGDSAAAIAALEAAKRASPGTLHAEEADGLLYEIKYLSAGLPAPAVSGKARNGGAVSLAALRGKPVVLVFWGST
jgi:hypothetical protein